MKMKDELCLPLAKHLGGVLPFVRESDGTMACVAEDRHADAMIHAVNCHDDLVEALEAMDEYLNTDRETTIGSGSAIHRQIKDLITKAKGGL